MDNEFDEYVDNISGEDSSIAKKGLRAALHAAADQDCTACDDNEICCCEQDKKNSDSKIFSRCLSAALPCPVCGLDVDCGIGVKSVQCPSEFEDEDTMGENIDDDNNISGEDSIIVRNGLRAAPLAADE
jgi:hypothetical protein